MLDKQFHNYVAVPMYVYQRKDLLKQEIKYLECNIGRIKQSLMRDCTAVGFIHKIFLLSRQRVLELFIFYDPSKRGKKKKY